MSDSNFAGLASMVYFGRRIILTSLTEIPRLFRASPGYLVLNQTEIDALERNDGPTFKKITEIVKAEDMADALLQLRPKQRRRKASLKPSSRLALLHAVYGGRHVARKSA